MARPFEEMPGPPGHYWSGNLPEMSADALGYFTECARTYGDVVRMRFWRYPGVQLAHPDHVHEVFVQHNDALTKSVDFHMLKVMLGTGLLISEGSVWRRQRRMIQPTFAPDRVRAYGSLAVELTKARVDGWRAGDALDLSKALSQLSLQVAAKAFLDVSLADGGMVVGEALDRFMNEFERIWTGSVLPLPTLATGRALFARWRLDRLIYRLIAERRGAPASGDDLLTRLVALRDDAGGLSDREIRDQVVTLLMAGHETTALAVSFALMLLAQHPEVHDALVRSLEETLGGRAPTVEDLPRLTAAQNVVLEAMRLYPPAWAMGRATLRPIEVAGYAVPKGTQIYVLPWITHRDPRFFDAPDVFRPDRWTHGVDKKAYFPFGGGPRKCIGAHLAMMEATLMVATIAARVRLKLAEDHALALQPAVTLRPRDGIRVVVA